MSELLQQPVFLKDLHQPFFLKELPSIVGDEPPIDVGHLARTSLGERRLELQVLELFDRQAEMLLSCMHEVVPAEVASAAHMLAGSAREIGARRVAEAAEELVRAVVENRELASALRTLDCAVIEARLAICAMLRTQLSTRRPPSLPRPQAAGGYGGGDCSEMEHSSLRRPRSSVVSVRPDNT